MRVALATALVLSTTAPVVAAQTAPAADTRTAPARDDARGADWPWHPPASRLVFAMAAGPSWHSLHGVGIAGGELALSLGMDTRHVSWGVGLTGGLGATEAGLMTSQLAIEGGVHVPLKRLRLGAGPRIGWVSVERVTTDARFQLLSLGLVGDISVDLFSDGETAVALGVCPSWEGVLSPKLFELGSESAGLYGIAGRASVRWRQGP